MPLIDLGTTTKLKMFQERRVYLVARVSRGWLEMEDLSFIHGFCL